MIGPTSGPNAMEFISGRILKTGIVVSLASNLGFFRIFGDTAQPSQVREE